VICDERLNTEEDLAAGQVHLLVSLRSARPGEYQSFLITHGTHGSRVRPVRSNVLPAGTRLHVEEAAEDEAVDVVAIINQAREDEVIDLDATQPRETLPQDSPVQSDSTTQVVTEPSEHEDSTTIVAAHVPESPRSAEDSTTLVLRVSEAAAPGGLDRDDIARFYRDFGGGGQQP
jgi:hypothetical protein